MVAKEAMANNSYQKYIGGNKDSNSYSHGSNGRKIKSINIITEPTKLKFNQNKTLNARD